MRLSVAVRSRGTERPLIFRCGNISVSPGRYEHGQCPSSGKHCGPYGVFTPCRMVVNRGSVVNNGTFSLTGGPSWTQSGGALSGSNPVAIQSGSLVDSAGTGQFVLTDTVGLSGTIPLGQTVTVSGGALDSKALITGNVTNNGTLVLDQPAGTGFADVEAYSGTPTLTNNGTVKSTVEGIGQNYLEINLENASGGKLEVASGLLQQDFATTTTNDAGGTVQVDGAGVFELTHAGGSVVNSGSV